MKHHSIYIIISSVVILSTCLFGCLTPVKPNYSLKYYLNPKIEEQKGTDTGLILAIRGFECSRAISNYVIYIDNGKLYYTESEEWAEHPADVIQRLVTKSLENTGRFSDVASSVEIKNPDMILVGEITQFYCSEENESEKIIISLTIRIRETKTSRIIFAKEFQIEHEFNEETQQVNDATNDALSQLSKSLQNEINKIDFNPLVNK